TPAPVKAYVDSMQKLLGPKPEGAAPEAPKEKEGTVPAPKGISVQQDVLWEEDYDDYRRAQALKGQPQKTLEAGVAEAHVVETGDTLWDLSGRYLNNNWMWPRVWSYNPHITNPHWIYPGQVIRFRSASTIEEPTPLGTTTRPRPRIIPAITGVSIFLH